MCYYLIRQYLLAQDYLRLQYCKCPAITAHGCIQYSFNEHLDNPMCLLLSLPIVMSAYHRQDNDTHRLYDVTCIGKYSILHLSILLL